MPSATLRFGQWAPDQPAIGQGLVRDARNVTPTRAGFQPFPGLQPISAALPQRASGLVAARARDGGTRRFAGGQTQLYRLDGSSWTAVGKPGGYAATQTTRWRFVPFGDRLVGLNFENATQYIDMSTGSAFADLPNAPRARFGAAYNDFLFLGHTADSAIEVRWSAFNNSEQWTVGLNQSDRQTLQDGGAVTGIAVADICYIFQEQSIRRAVYVGPPLIMQLDVVERGRGCVEANSLAQLGRRMFYLAEDGFQAFDGLTSTPIGWERVDGWFRARFNRGFSYRMSAAIDPVAKLVGWAFPSQDSPAGQPDTLLIYNWAADRWAYATFRCELLSPLTTVGTTLEELDALAAPFGGIENFPISPDDPALAGGVLRFGAMNESQQLAYFSGPALEAVIETDDLEISAGLLQFVEGARPLVDASAYVAMGVRMRPQDPVAWKPETQTNVQGIAPQRATARYARSRTRIPAGAAWTHAQAVELITKPAGMR